MKELLTIFYSRGLESRRAEREKRKMKDKLATGSAKKFHTCER